MDKILLEMLLDDDYGIPINAYFRILEIGIGIRDKSLTFGPLEELTVEYLEELHNRIKIQDDRAFLTEACPQSAKHCGKK